MRKIRLLVIIAALAAHAGDAGAIPNTLLEPARALAEQQLQDYPACARLFEDLGADGLLVLRSIRLREAVSPEERQVCRRRHAWAFTQVGALGVVTCPSLKDLSLPGTARVLIHEGLHAAWMPELPAPGARLTAHEIDRMVARSCHLP